MVVSHTPSWSDGTVSSPTGLEPPPAPSEQNPPIWIKVTGNRPPIHIVYSPGEHHYRQLTIRDLAGPDLIAFHCWACAADYCEACWRIGPPEFDATLPGFYDCTYGICPAEHEQIVDD